MTGNVRTWNVKTWGVNPPWLDFGLRQTPAFVGLRRDKLLRRDKSARQGGWCAQRSRAFHSSDPWFRGGHYWLARKKIFVIYTVLRLAQVGTGWRSVGERLARCQATGDGWEAGKRTGQSDLGALPRLKEGAHRREADATMVWARFRSDAPASAKATEDRPARQAKSTRNLTVSPVILRKWLGDNGRWRVFSKCEGEIVKKMSNSAVTMG